MENDGSRGPGISSEQSKNFVRLAVVQKFAVRK
jgi:hypothetical protein